MQTVLVGSVRRTPKGDIAISKIKVKDDWETIEITFELPPEGKEKKVVKMTGKERPRNELIKSFQNIMEQVKSMADLNWEVGWITAIAFKDDEDEGLSVTITAQNEVATVVLESFFPGVNFYWKFKRRSPILKIILAVSDRSYRCLKMPKKQPRCC